MQPVAVRILHPSAAPDVGPLSRWLVEVRAANADRLAARFADAGADDVAIIAGPPDGRSFGARLRELIGGVRAGSGLVVLGSGAIPIAGRGEVALFVEVAGSGERRARANNAYSADIVAIGRVDALPAIPDLSGDNALPRWLAEVAGFRVDDVRSRWRLSVDLDTPLDVLLLDPTKTVPGVDLTALRDRLTGVRAVARDRRAELVIAGRTSGRALEFVERRTEARTRMLIEERGLRASSLEALGADPGLTKRRPPRSILGLLLDDRGPGALGSIVAELGDAAIVDSRVLLAHRLGASEAGWPAPEDRYASDLLLPDRITDPWLRELTASALAAPIPILLGGHSLVGPGVRLLFGRHE